MIDSSVFVQHYDAGVDTAQNQLVVFLLLDGFFFDVVQDACHFVQCPVDYPVFPVVVVLVEVDGVVIVFNGIEQKEYVAYVAAVKPVLPV